MRSSFLLPLLVIATSAPPASAPPAIAQSVEGPHPAAIESWIEMLDSPKYRQRAEATGRLERLGPTAIDKLETVILGGTREASNRAFEIVRRQQQSEDAIRRAAATELLQRIASNPDHPKAKAATELLEPASADRESDPTLPAAAIPLMNPRIPVPRLPEINRQTRVTIANGLREIEIQENGKSIRVRETPQGIEVRKDDGAGNITTKSYKDAAELKDQDVEASRLLDQNPIGGLKIQLGPGRGEELPENVRKLQEQALQRHLELHRQQRERLRRSPPAPPSPDRPPPPDSAPDPPNPSNALSKPREV